MTEQIIIQEAEYLLTNKATLRQTAKYFARSKSAVHTDMQKRLPDISLSLAEQVKQILNVNLAERHIRGGMMTKQRYAEREVVYYRVKKDCDNFQTKEPYFQILVGGELFTEKERKQLSRIPDKAFEKVCIPKNRTYWLFGARFPLNEEGNK